MRIINASFNTSLDDYLKFQEQDLAQIVVIGKSNVGKSSLINAICDRNKLCKTSSTPGKTRLINIFNASIVDEQNITTPFHLVDLPGYGYAKVNQNEKIKWGNMMENYFSQSKMLKHIFHLVDIRHEPTKNDIEMAIFLRSFDCNFSVIATKCDKISRGARMKHIAPICRLLNVQPWEITPFSSETKENKENILKLILESIKE